jgi:transposase-like protein
VIELARAGTRVAQLSVTFGMTETTIYNWLKQDRIDRGEMAGQTTDRQLELAAAKRRIKQLETELAVARKVNEVFLQEGVSPKGSSR